MYYIQLSALLKIRKLQMKMQQKYVTSPREIFHAATYKSPYKNSKQLVTCIICYVLNGISLTGHYVSVKYVPEEKPVYNYLV